MESAFDIGLKALVFGMGTVFLGLITLLAAMKTTTRLLTRPAPALAQGSAPGGEDYSQVQLSKPMAPAVTSDEGLPASAELIAAVAMALHLDHLALAELEEQRLTWTRMFKPFSPWLMDSKNSLHTHRIRFRATSATGTIVRERTGRS
jgi:Na+-transporting methylmalonyl-CoA/oxaloacetate decarboxylase gamma subunit